jgi:AMP-binding enzyme
VNRLANALLADGLTKGDTLATVLPNCLEQLEVYWAAAKTGLVVVPMSPLLQESGLASLLDNSDASLERHPAAPLTHSRAPGRLITHVTTLSTGKRHLAQAIGFESRERARPRSLPAPRRRSAPERHPGPAVAEVCSLASWGGGIPLDQRSVPVENPVTLWLSALYRGANGRACGRAGVLRADVPSTGPLFCLRSRARGES